MLAKKVGVICHRRAYDDSGKCESRSIPRKGSHPLAPNSSPEGGIEHHAQPRRLLNRSSAAKANMCRSPNARLVTDKTEKQGAQRWIATSRPSAGNLMRALYPPHHSESVRIANGKARNSIPVTMIRFWRPGLLARASRACIHANKSFSCVSQPSTPPEHSNLYAL